MLLFEVYIKYVSLPPHEHDRCVACSAPDIRATMSSRLDENVIALSMLGTVPSAQRSQSHARRMLFGAEQKWCCLLDEISWLCDYQTGGKSVTSVAVQGTATGNVFWFASNKETRTLVKNHLRWILGELQSMAANGTVNGEEIQWRLFKKSVAFNHRRVESYWERLRSLVQHTGLSGLDEQRGN